MSPPFSGVRVLDFTRYLAGPYATHQLAVLGADVIKIEPPEGDDLRGWRDEADGPARGMPPGFVAYNVNKRSIALDMRKPQAVEIVHRLARDADLVCENFRPGVADRLGIGWRALAEVNPRLVYCSISGFGATGPERDKPSFDGKIQALSGIMALTGEPAQGPMRAGIALADIATGLTAAFAMASALHQRTHTGRGQYVDVSMLDSMLSLLSWEVAQFTIAGARIGQRGNLSPSGKVTGDRFRCGDGWLMLAVMTDAQFERLMRALGRADALADARFADWAARAAHREALREVIEGAMAHGTPLEWERRLTEADVPCGAILRVDETIELPQLAHRRVLQSIDTAAGRARLVENGFELAHGDGAIVRDAPRLGEHADEILALAGYASHDIERLRRERVLGGDAPQGT